MTVGSTHPDYDSNAATWSRARDVLAGEDAVKAAGEKYLPRLDSQSEEEYLAYKARASFFGATARTLEEYLDLIFRRAPVVSGERGARSEEPANSKELGAGSGESTKMSGFLQDCDLWGMDFLRYAREVVRGCCRWGVRDRLCFGMKLPSDHGFRTGARRISSTGKLSASAAGW